MSSSYFLAAVIVVAIPAAIGWLILCAWAFIAWRERRRMQREAERAAFLRTLNEARFTPFQRARLFRSIEGGKRDPVRNCEVVSLGPDGPRAA